ncbi:MULTISPECIES: hypothetical protein [unclassified Streptomyces]|uniref:hypothetical protein n=1 Tax=unclassified Streptomyces TaxID=2593676 RepID=UPI00114CEBBB|nr:MULTISPECIES: hypothetical protein [unclassified Streptomyces]MYZ33875.1 hypothetical protein [Streptomyces sp. SID4917]
MKHKVPSLMLTLDDAWPGLQDAAEAALRAVFPYNATCRLRRKGCQNIPVAKRASVALMDARVGAKH